MSARYTHAKPERQVAAQAKSPDTITAILAAHLRTTAAAAIAQQPQRSAALGLTEEDLPTSREAGYLLAVYGSISALVGVKPAELMDRTPVSAFTAQVVYQSFINALPID